MNMNKQTGREGRAPQTNSHSISHSAIQHSGTSSSVPGNGKPSHGSSTHASYSHSRSKSSGRTGVASNPVTRVVNELTQTDDSMLHQSELQAQSRIIDTIDPNTRAAAFQASFLYDPQATPASSIPPSAAHHSSINSAANAPNEHMNISMLNTSAAVPSISRVTAPTSTDTSFVLPGSARISDLNPTDKSKIGKLLQEIVILKKEGIEAQSKKKELEQNVELLEIKHSLTLKEAHQLKAEYEASLDLIKSYQAKLNEVHESPELKFAIQQREERAKQVQQSFSSSHQSPSISKLHQLNERAKAAANVSAAVSAAASLNASYVDPIITTATVTANSMPPFSSVIRSLSSSPYRSLSGIPPTTSYSSAAMPGLSLPSTGYNTDEEVPRSAAPRPSAQPSPHAHIEERNNSHYSSGVHEIERAYANNLTEAQHSLSPRRRLDLEHAVSASPNRHQLEQSHFHDHRFLHHSRSRTPSPSRPTAAIIHTKSAVVNPREVALIPHAVSGVTRAMASSSPEQIEKRARQLAQDMYDRKIEEDRRTALQTTVNEAYVHSHSQMKPYHAYNPSQLPSRSQPSHSSLYPTKAEEEEKRPAESHDRVSSLSAFLNSHPLTSTLSPMVKLKPKQQPHEDAESSPSKPRSANKKKSKRTPEKEFSILKELQSTASLADGPSEYASSILNRSMRLAERFAQEKRAREHTLNSNPSASTTNSLNSSKGRAHVDSEADEEEEKSKTTGVLDSPFSSLALSSSQVAQMTPTSRRIHRLLAIQNPQLVQQQHEEKEALERERLARQKEKERLAEMHEKRRKQLEGAEMRAKQAQERAQAVAAALSKMPPKLSTIIDSPIQPEAPAQEDEEAVDEFTSQLDTTSSTPKPMDRIVVTTPSGSQVLTHIPSGSNTSSKPPIHPTARSKTPVETYVPPPFSFRPKSRTHQSRQQQPQDDHDQQQQLLNASVSSPAPTANSRATASADSTPASQALSTPQHHENMHQSFTSPLPTGRSNATPGTAGSDMTAEYLQEDAEMWDLFHLRSPSSLQQVQQAQTIEREMQNELAARRRNVPHHTPSEQYSRSKQQQIQDRYTRNFANDMMEASGLSPEGVNRRSGLDTESDIPTSGNSYYRATPFEYSSAYPTSRSTMPAPQSSSTSFASSTPSAPPKAVSASPSKSDDLQARLDSLRLKQLEEELEDVMPQVLQGLVQHSKHKQQPPPSGSQIQLPMTDAGFSPRLSQPSSPIALISHKKRTVELSPQAPAQEREEKDDEAQNRSNAHSALNLSQRYKAHVDAYAVRRQQLQQRSSPSKSRGAPRFTSEADASSMVSTDFDGEHETSLLDIIDQMQEDEQ